MDESQSETGCTDLIVQMTCQVHLLRCTHHANVVGAFIKMYMTSGQHHRWIY